MILVHLLWCWSTHPKSLKRPPDSSHQILADGQSFRFQEKRPQRLWGFVQMQRSGPFDCTEWTEVNRVVFQGPLVIVPSLSPASGVIGGQHWRNMHSHKAHSQDEGRNLRQSLLWLYLRSCFPVLPLSGQSLLPDPGVNYGIMWPRRRRSRKNILNISAWGRHFLVTFATSSSHAFLRSARRVL